MTICIAWFTNRKTAKLRWFVDALTRQKTPEDRIELVVVDHYAPENWKTNVSRLNGELLEGLNWELLVGAGIRITHHVTPYPNPYQGRFKITQEEWFNASAARNTAICLCRESHIVFADDLSCPMPGWLTSVKRAIATNRITLGTYRKVLQMVVTAGVVTSFTDHPSGHDHRVGVIASRPRQFPPVAHGLYAAPKEWWYGCSVAMPIEPLLGVGGFLEAMSASQGYEDCAMSRMLSNNGHQFFIDTGMLTFESEELHHGPGQFFRRRDPCRGKRPDGANDDMSHALLDATATLKYHPNNFDPGGIRELRKKVLSGEQFPERRHPQHCWWTKEPLEKIGEHYPR
jgi:hypothetical protein